jgi:hypothetical protein
VLPLLLLPLLLLLLQMMTGWLLGVSVVRCGCCSSCWLLAC